MMKIAIKKGFNQERKKTKINVPQDKAPGNISKNLKRARSFELFKSDALPILR